MAGWHIVHVCRTGWPVVGGMETAVQGLARTQAAAGARVEVVTLLYAPDGRGLPDVDHEGVRYRRLHRVGPWRYPFAWGLRRAVEGADLVHVHGLDGLADRLVRARVRPRVGISTHGGYFHSRRMWAVKQGVLRSVTRGTLRRADAVWYTSEVDRDALSAAGVPGEVVPNGVEVEGWLRNPRGPVRGRWVVLGRLDQHKGIDRVLPLVAQLPSVRLDLVGPDAGAESALRRQATELEIDSRVRFLGELGPTGLAEALGRCELALFPSRHEGFGIAVVEAMAAGAPVVVSDIAAHRALVRDGVSGFVIDFDANDAAETLRRIGAEGAERVSEAARQASKVHGWDRRIDDWNRAYAHLLALPQLAAGMP